MSELLNAIYRFNVIPIKIPKAFLTEMEKNNPKTHMESQKNVTSQSNLEKEEQCWRQHTIPDFKIYYKAIVIKTAEYRHKNRHVDQRNRIQSLEINSCIYGQRIFNKGAKNTQQGKDGLFDKWCWENWLSTC